MRPVSPLPSFALMTVGWSRKQLRRLVAVAVLDGLDELQAVGPLELRACRHGDQREARAKGETE